MGTLTAKVGDNAVPKAYCRFKGAKSELPQEVLVKHHRVRSIKRVMSIFCFSSDNIEKNSASIFSTIGTN